MLPLCCNCHNLYDSRDRDIDRASLLGRRAVRLGSAEAVTALVDFIVRELAGRPSRGTDEVGLAWPLDPPDDEIAAHIQTFIGIVRGRSARSSRT